MAQLQISYTSSSKEIASFIKRALIFLFIIFTILVVFALINNYLYSKSKVELPEACTIVFTGDSHIRGGVFSRLIPGSVNIAQKAEPSSLSFYKIRKILLDNPKINTVYVAYSFNNVAPMAETHFNIHRWAEEFFSRIYPIINISELKNINPNWRKCINIFSKKWFSPNLEYIFNQNKNMHDYPFIGNVDLEMSEKGIKKLEKKLENFGKLPSTSLISVRKLKKKLKIQFEKYGIKDLSKTSILHYEKLIELTKEKEVNLIFLAMPMHKDLIKAYPSEFKEKYYDLVENFESKNSHVKFMDLSSEIKSEKLFRNHSHLNSLGGVYFSKKLLKIIGN